MVTVTLSLSQAAALISDPSTQGDLETPLHEANVRAAQTTIARAIEAAAHREDFPAEEVKPAAPKRKRGPYKKRQPDLPQVNGAAAAAEGAAK